ncbi:MAG: IclR family transcriptional regulator [Trueperaceae bacterium]|nr:IclR family transcriptional regulator [Trueperaceae bacterium]
MSQEHRREKEKDGPLAAVIEKATRAEPKLNKAVVRAMRVLAEFDEDTPEWTVNALSRRLGIAKSSVSTVLATLAEFDLVARAEDGSGRYRLGLRCMEMGYLSSSRLQVRDLAFPLLERLLGETQQIVYLAIPYQREVLYVEAMYPPHRRINFSSQGRRAPLYCTGIGKAILAFLPVEDQRDYLSRAPFPRLTSNTLCRREELEREIEETHARGYATDHEEREHGIRCVASPVLSRFGQVVAAVSISGSSDEIDEDRIPQLAQIVHATAVDVGRKLQFAGHGGRP